MGLTVNRQMAKKSTVNRQKRNIFYRQPSNERAKISRQIPSLIFSNNFFSIFFRFLNFLKKILHNFLYFFQVFLIFFQTIFF